MAFLWSDEEAAGPVRETARVGQWKDGVYVPAQQWPPRGPRVTMVRDIVRTLLDLRAT